MEKNVNGKNCNRQIMQWKKSQKVKMSQRSSKCMQVIQVKEDNAIA